MIDWRPVQTNLGVGPDGIAGPNTWRALIRRVASNYQPSQGTINSLATACIIHCPEYEATDTPQRLAWLLAETCNETGGYARFEENLNYSAEALTRTWPKRFPAAKAQQYARKPELIAAVAYGDRMGNLTPQEGWLFRGRGMIQLTGRGNYEAANKRLGIGLDTNPEMAAVPALSLLIALDFYKANGVFARIDAGDTEGARKITNGALIGYSNVLSLYNKAMGVLA